MANYMVNFVLNKIFTNIDIPTLRITADRQFGHSLDLDVQRYTFQRKSQEETFVLQCQWNY